MKSTDFQLAVVAVLTASICVITIHLLETLPRTARHLGQFGRLLHLLLLAALLLGTGGSELLGRLPSDRAALHNCARVLLGDTFLGARRDLSVMILVVVVVVVRTSGFI